MEGMKVLKSLNCTRPPPTPPQCGGEGSPHNCWVEVQVQDPHVVSTDTVGWYRELLTSGEYKCPDSLLGLL